jgi:methionine-gamma-lyase
MTAGRGGGISTLSVHAGESPDPATGALSVPIYQTAPFSAPDVASLARRAAGEDGFIYTRSGNPTIVALERKLAALEGAADAVAFGSGMGAIAASFLAVAPPGSRILVPSEVYGGTSSLVESSLRPLGFDVRRCGAITSEIVSRLRAEPHAVVYFETPTNPTLRVLDVAEIARVARETGAMTIVDSTFATPVLTRPLALGVDVVVHSATKFLSGHCDVTAGIAAGSPEICEGLRRLRDRFGACLDPHAAWLALRGMKTLGLRMERQCENAAVVASALSAHRAVTRVNWPGVPGRAGQELAARQMSGRYGAMLSFELAGGAPALDRFVAALACIRIIPSLGGVETGISIPAVTSHRQLDPEVRAGLGIGEALVRMSVGIEDSADLVAELSAALDRAL